MHRASYQQLVNDVIINPHAPESGENDDAVDHVSTDYLVAAA